MRRRIRQALRQDPTASHASANSAGLAPRPDGISSVSRFSWPLGAVAAGHVASRKSPGSSGGRQAPCSVCPLAGAAARAVEEVLGVGQAEGMDVGIHPGRTRVPIDKASVQQQDFRMAAKPIWAMSAEREKRGPACHHHYRNPPRSRGNYYSRAELLQRLTWRKRRRTVQLYPSSLGSQSNPKRIRTSA